MGPSGDLLAWNLFGYTTEKLGQLLGCFPGALAYALFETHLPSGCPLIGLPAGYRVLEVPNMVASQREGVVVLVHHQVRILRSW